MVATRSACDTRLAGGGVGLEPPKRRENGLWQVLWRMQTEV